MTIKQASRRAAGSSRAPMLGVALGVLLYSTGPVMLQASALSGPAFSFWRLWMGAALFGAATVAWTRRRGWPELRAWRVSLGAGIAFGGHQLMMFTAVKITTVADVSLMNALAPVVTAIGAAWVFSEHPGADFWRWSGVAIAGAAVIALGGSSGPRGDSLGMTLAALNVVAFAAFFLLQKKSRDQLDVVPFLFGVMLVAALLVSTYVAATTTSVGEATGRDLLLALGVAAGPGAVGHALMTWALRWVPANIPPVMRLAQPILSGALAWWLLSEPITGYHLLGGAVVLLGVGGALLSRSGRRLRAAASAGSGG